MLVERLNLPEREPKDTAHGPQLGVRGTTAPPPAPARWVRHRARRLCASAMVAGLWHTKVVEAASRHGLIGATASSGSLSSRFLSPARAQLPDKGFYPCPLLDLPG